MESYFVISSTEDGLYIKTMSKRKLLEELEEEQEYEEPPEIHSKFPEFVAGDELPLGTYIIKGKLVVPTEKQVVTEFEIE